MRVSKASFVQCHILMKQSVQKQDQGFSEITSGLTSGYEGYEGLLLAQLTMITSALIFLKTRHAKRYTNTDQKISGK